MFNAPNKVFALEGNMQVKLLDVKTLDICLPSVRLSDFVICFRQDMSMGVLHTYLHLEAGLCFKLLNLTSI